MDAADVKAFFDEVAPDWDTMRLTYYDERVIEQLAARTQLTGEQTVVDVGTGTGFVAAGLAAHAHRVLGFDNAASMLDVARANVDRLGVDNVELAEGDVATTPSTAATAPTPSTDKRGPTRAPVASATRAASCPQLHHGRRAGRP